MTYIIHAATHPNHIVSSASLFCLAGLTATTLLLVGMDLAAQNAIVGMVNMFSGG